MLLPSELLTHHSTCSSFHLSPTLPRRRKAASAVESDLAEGAGTHVFLYLSHPDREAFFLAGGADLGARPP